LPSEIGYGKDITEGKQKQLEPINAKILVSSENAKPLRLTKVLINI
jgi:hypothetical protein